MVFPLSQARRLISFRNLRAWCGRLLAGALKSCPRRWRFPLMQRVAYCLQPFVRLMKPNNPLQGPRERSLWFLLNRLFEHDIDFAPALHAPQAHLLEETGGALILTSHHFLNRLFMLWLTQQGRKVTLVSGVSDLSEHLGSNHLVERIRPNEQTYLRVRQRVRDNHIVIITAEALRPIPNSRPLQLGGVTHYVSETAPRFAERARIPLLFAFTRIANGGQVVVNLARPSTTQADVAMDEFCQFLSREVAQMHA